ASSSPLSRGDKGPVGAATPPARLERHEVSMKRLGPGPPFTRLPAPRAMDGDEMPIDLAAFYCLHEGAGLEGAPDLPVRLCRLDEVGPVELGLAGEPLDGLLVGVGPGSEAVVYLLGVGSVLVVVNGAMPRVLAGNFLEWLDELERQAGAAAPT